MALTLPGAIPLGREVVLLGGDLVAIELAELLAELLGECGRRVCVVESGEMIAPEVGPKRRGEHMDRLDRLGVSVLAGRWARRITDREVILEDGRALRAESVLIAGRIEAAPSLVLALEGRVPEVQALGGCMGLGLVRKATEDAARVACAS